MSAQGSFAPIDSLIQSARRSMAPQKVLMLTCFCALIVLFSGSQYLLQLPFFNIELSTQSEQVVWVNSKGEPEPVLGVLHHEKLLPLTARDLREDPDFISSFAELNAYFNRQQVLFNVLQNERITLLLANGESVTFQKSQRNWRDIPAVYWLLNAYAALALLTGFAFWAYHRGKPVTRILALGGLGCYLMQASMAVYGAREIALNAQVFLWLLHLNHLGGFLFITSLVTLLWFYPKPIQQVRYMYFVCGVALLIWLNELGQWIEWPINIFYFPALFLIVFTVGVLKVQWSQSCKNRQDKKHFLWLMYSILGGVGLAFFAYVAPMLIMGEPLVSTWMANTFCLLVFLGFVLGVHFGGLFAVERWWLKAFLSVALAVLLILCDLIAITFLGAQAALGFSLAAIVTFWIYLVFRGRLWNWLSGRNHNRHVFQSMLLKQPTVSEQIAGDNYSPEVELIASLFTPLSIAVVDKVYGRPTLIDNGLKLGFSFPVCGLTVVKSYVLIGKQKGQQNFSEQDVQFLIQFIEHTLQTEKLHQAREATLLAERDRIMRDLHDEVAADLLGLSHQLHGHKAQPLAQQCLKNLREIVYSMDDSQERSLWDAIAKWRVEFSQLVDPSGIKIEWVDTVAEDRILTGAQWLHLSRSLRELLSNAIKHAQPTCIYVCLSEVNGELQLEISNDGAMLSQEQWKHGKGILSIQRRIQQLYGKVTWQVADTWCHARIAVPL